MWDSQDISEFDMFLLRTNKVEASSLEGLSYKERKITNKKAIELSIKPIQGNFDYKHLKDIHKYLFEDIYTWAGQDRLEIGLNAKFGNKFDKMDKNGLVTHFTHTDQVSKFANEIFDNLRKENNFSGLNIDKFTEKSANFLMKLNTLHPFREGNGRTQRIFLNQLAENAGYKMDLNLIDKETFTEAVTMASRDSNPKPLEALIKENLESFKENLTKSQKEPKITISEDGTPIMSKKFAKELEEKFAEQDTDKTGIEI